MKKTIAIIVGAIAVIAAAYAGVIFYLSHKCGEDNFEDDYDYWDDYFEED